MEFCILETVWLIPRTASKASNGMLLFLNCLITCMKYMSVNDLSESLLSNYKTVQFSLLICDTLQVDTVNKSGMLRNCSYVKTNYYFCS